MLDRKTVARRLGVTVAYVCASLDRRYLHPIRDANGRVSYTESDLEQALLRWKRVRAPKKEQQPIGYMERVERGKLARDVFLLLGEGKSYHEIVIATQGDPEWIREFYEDYNTSPEQRAAMRELEKLQADSRERRIEAAKQLVREQRLRIRETIANADFLRAQRGEARSVVSTSGATLKEDGKPAPLLPPLPSARAFEKRFGGEEKEGGGEQAPEENPTPKKTA